MKDMKGLIKTEIPGFPMPMLPPALPPMEYKAGLVTLVENWIHNRKLQQLALAKKLEAEISQDNLKAFKAQCEMMSYFLLQGQAIQTELESMRHRNAMEEALLHQVKLTNIKASEEIKGLQLDNQRMELQHQQMLKMLKGVGNGTDND